MPSTFSATRPLLLVAGLGFLVSMVCLAIALALAGGEFHRLGRFHGHWSMWDMHGPQGPWTSGGGPTVTRELTWPGGDKLAIQVPGTVTFTQGPTAKVTVTGPQGTVEALRFDDESLRLDRRVRDAGRVEVTITAPDVREFSVMGSGALNLQAVDQDRLELHVFGSGDITAQGRARDVELDVAGSGQADLAALASDTTEVNIAGSGRAVIAPKQRAELNVAGSGEVVLNSRPPTVEQHVMGSGRIIQGESDAPPAPSVAPAPRLKPSKTVAT